jgi:cell shape-determining protein MreC
MAGWACLAITHGWAAQGNSSLTDLDIEFTEAKVTLQTVADENQLLKKQLAQSRETIQSLTESLAESNSEAEEFRRKSGELTLRMEALGIDASNNNKLQQRLLKAVNDLRIVQAEKDKLSDQLVRLTEAMLRFLKTASSTDADARMAVETETRTANELLGLPSTRAEDATAVPSTLEDAMVISIKDEWALVVANVGSRHGVKMGMPFKVIRGDTEIGLVRVVNVRENISGAVIQNLSSEKEKIKVGDLLKVDAQQ